MGSGISFTNEHGYFPQTESWISPCIFKIPDNQMEWSLFNMMNVKSWYIMKQQYMKKFGSYLDDPYLYINQLCVVCFINQLPAKLFKKCTKYFLHFLSFLNTDIAWGVKILFIPLSQYHGHWWIGGDIGNSYNKNTIIIYKWLHHNYFILFIFMTHSCNVIQLTHCSWSVEI